MTTRADLLAQLAELRKQIDSLPPEPGELPDEPPDIRKTNASDDPCPLCQQVHSKDPAAPVVCRCLYCGQIGPIAMSTHDPALGQGVVCRRCCSGFAPDYQRAESEASARGFASKMPWE